jgi:hypothetical protein
MANEAAGHPQGSAFGGLMDLNAVGVRSNSVKILFPLSPFPLRFAP